MVATMLSQLAQLAAVYEPSAAVPTASAGAGGSRTSATTASPTQIRSASA